MRSHGVSNFPDPSGSGGVRKETAQQLGISESVLDTANSDCQSLLLPGESLSGQATQTVIPQEQQDYLNVTACMHSHGFPTFPEPAFSRMGQVEFPMVQQLLDISSPGFAQAYHTCQKLIPTGLPFTGSEG